MTNITNIVKTLKFIKGYDLGGKMRKFCVQI